MREHRVRITREPAGITAQVKARRHAFLTIFLPIWLTLWTIGGIVAITTVITGTDRQPFLLLWLAGWLIGETMALVVFLWTTFGEELISVRNGMFTYQRTYSASARSESVPCTRYSTCALPDSLDHWMDSTPHWSNTA
ncbi:MAG TPA: hypothetical protein VFY34_09090 [Pyrinomonadaceae bacterium]|nr:hypothetical protein [Pyrinomonadaceae bacterium]